MLRSDFSFDSDQAALSEHMGSLFTRQSTWEAVRAAEPLGFDADLWQEVSQVGLAGICLDEAVGGGGGSFVDATIVMVEAGRCAASVPLAEQIAAGRLAARCGLSNDDLASIAQGRTRATLAVGGAHDGVFPLVPGGAVAHLVFGATDAGVALTRQEPSMSAVPNIACAPIADCPLGEPVAADRSLVERAVDEWRVLMAAQLVGLAQRALDLGVDYVKERHQFGRPIGAFQAVQHGLADLVPSLDGARSLVFEAAQLIDRDDPLTGVVAAMAFSFAAQTARAATATALHFHGGYGVMLEYDIQLLYRRARGWSLALGDPQAELEVLATRLFGPVGAPQLGDYVNEPDLIPEDAYRAATRAMLAQVVDPASVERAHATGTFHDWDMHRALAERGIIAAGIGSATRSGADPLEMHTLFDELGLADAPFFGLALTMLVAGVIEHIGSEFHRHEILPRLHRGEAMFALGYSEPDAGSDVAAAITRAVPDPERADGWVINGQKIFTTLAHEAAYVILLTRTNPDVAKHRGLTMFLVPLDLPGIEIQPVHTMGGDRTNMTFYTDVRVGDEWRIGEVDGGWDVMKVALAYERGVMGNTNQGVRLLQATAAWAAETPRAGGVVLDDATVRTRLAQIAIDNEVTTLLSLRAATIASRGGQPAFEGASVKLFASEAYTRAAEACLDIAGVDGVRQDALAPGHARIERSARDAPVTTIYGGTSEIQRNLIAEMHLGLPKSR